MEVQPWMFQGKPLTSPPEGYYGFIYCVIDDQGKKYWGKKAFLHKKRTVLSKKARAGGRKRYKQGTTDSKWLTYWGSSKPLLEYIKERGGTEGFKREIIKLCVDRASWNYWELATLIEEKVLFRDDSWNGNIAGRYFKNKIHT